MTNDQHTPDQVAENRPAPDCREAGYCCGPNAQVGVCDCHDDIWQGEKWWEPKGATQS